MSSQLQRRRRAKLAQEKTIPSAFEETTLSQLNESDTNPTPVLKAEDIQEEKIEEAYNYPDPDEQESEVEDEIDTSAVVEPAADDSNWNARNSGEPNSNDIQQVLMSLFGGALGANGENGQSANPDMANFLQEFAQGFAQGFAASAAEENTQQNIPATTAVEPPASNSVFMSFLFGSGSNLQLLIAVILIIFEVNPFPAYWYILTALCATRFSYFFFIASASEAAALTYILLIFALCYYFDTTCSWSIGMGDILSVIIDSFFFFVGSYTRFRFHMFVDCWIIGHVPDYPYMQILSKLPLNFILMVGFPILSVFIIMGLYVKERKEQRKHVLFIQNFLSVFTNPEMQEGEMKSVIGQSNEIKNEESLKRIVIDAYAIHTNSSRAEAETFVNMYFKRAIAEYNRVYVISSQ